LSILNNEESHINERIELLKSEYIQAENLVGSRVLDLKSSFVNHDVHIDDAALRALHHEIERMKIRLEDMGGGGSGDVLAEFDETVSRDAFLEKEINDLYSAVATLESTIRDLKEKLQGEFHTGIVKINREFETFFKLMFGGGEAKLALVNIEKRKKKSEEDLEDGTASLLEDEELRSAGETPEQGIDIDVSLPRKKVKDLEMLSGGERSLTSIALLFALSQVNPPPFLVLDETDAALDEANSKKYGDMIENLAKQTQLVVVTHNRETMSRADILYGVTLGSDDASTLLSIRFEEAVKVAK
jgi:chromosome segregation protein